MDAFYDIIDWLRPGFVLMENVLDILAKARASFPLRTLFRRWGLRRRRCPGGPDGGKMGKDEADASRCRGVPKIALCS